jgi:hypothetical protein
MAEPEPQSSPDPVSEQRPEPRRPSEGGRQGHPAPSVPDPPTSPDETQTTTPPAEGDDPAKLRREAAAYRTRLRESEADAKRLAERVREMQKANIEGSVSGPGRLADPSDLWLTTKVDDLLDEDGAINAEKVKAALDQTLADHPAWKDRKGPGLGGGVHGEQRTVPSFGEMVKNRDLRRRAR